MQPNITSETIRKTLDAHIPSPEGIRSYSSVLMPIFKTENGYELLF